MPAWCPQVAFLDHVFGVVDDATAAAIAGSDFLPSFGRFDVATVLSGDESWTGRYLCGRRTYVEVFGPGDLRGSDAPEATAGLGLSARAPGGLETLSERMASWGASLHTRRRTRDDGDDQVPWFDFQEVADTSPTFAAWVMEFLEEPSDLQIREAAFEAWMARPLENASPQGHPRGPTVSDLSLVQLTVSSDSIAATAPLLRASGFETVSTRDVVIAQDAETTIELHATTASSELKRVEFTLAPEGPDHVETIGHSRITVGSNGRAVWDFARP